MCYIDLVSGKKEIRGSHTQKAEIFATIEGQDFSSFWIRSKSWTKYSVGDVNQ